MSGISQHVYPFDNFNDAFKTMIANIMIHGITSSPRNLETKELFAPRIELKDPTKRWLTSRCRVADYTYCIGEFLWYMSKTNDLDFIKYYAPSIEKYSDDGVTLNSAYGYKIFVENGNQWDEVISKLTEDPDSRQATIFIRSSKDLTLDTKDSVCTNSLQFMIRENKLSMIVNMRSNDAMTGFIYDVFCFTMMQEIMAIELNVDLGSYIHIPNSLHIYEPSFDTANRVMNEDMDSFDLGPMSTGRGKNIEKTIHHILEIESLIKVANTTEQKANIINLIDAELTDYWKQIVFLLLAKKIRRDDKQKRNGYNTGLLGAIDEFYRCNRNRKFSSFIYTKHII